MLIANATERGVTVPSNRSSINPPRIEPSTALGAAILNPDWPRRIADPAYAPERGPLTPAELQALAISARFVEYLRRFRGMVRDG